ncbi:MAG: T9SS type A sorting domain-containing protein [Chitinophagaceae bacterium]|nr:MAG: T9SS type A sorting domain-containing protein [Chitinophagaceae bacterium]
MKRILCAILLFALCNNFSKSFAQSCGASSPVISNVLTTQNSSGTCTVTFDLEFNLDHNNGNKYSAVYIYSGAVPTSFYGNGKTVPTTASINAVTNILGVIEFNAAMSATKTLASYNGGGSSTNPSVFKSSLNFAANAINPNVDRYELKGITVDVPNCNTAVTLNADFGSANGSGFNSFGCISTIKFVPNTPTLLGQLGCNSPRYFTFTAKTLETETITFSAYADAARTQLLQAPAGFKFSGNGAPNGGISITSYENISLSILANTNTTFGQFPFQSANGSRFDVYLVIKTSSNNFNTNSLRIENACAILPVTFGTFEAQRKSPSSVFLKWSTLSEQNSKGFYVQRNTGSGWKDAGFVFSQTNNGYSSSSLAYEFKDVNSEKATTQYRILQVDNDGRGKYSDVRLVRGEEGAGKVVVYPNPTNNGKVSIAFESNGERDITVHDMSGRVVKQLSKVTSSNVVIDGLTSGFYTIQTVDRRTSEVTREKLVVNNK